MQRGSSVRPGRTGWPGCRGDVRSCSARLPPMLKAGFADAVASGVLSVHAELAALDLRVVMAEAAWLRELRWYADGAAGAAINTRRARPSRRSVPPTDRLYTRGMVSKPKRAPAGHLRRSGGGWVGTRTPARSGLRAGVYLGQLRRRRAGKRRPARSYWPASMACSPSLDVSPATVSAGQLNMYDSTCCLVVRTAW